MIILPKAPKGSAKLKRISNSTKVKAAYGGPTKLVNRLGDRFAYEVSTKARSSQAASVVAKLNQALGDTVRIPVNQTVDWPTLSAVTVGAAVSGGQTINLKGSGKLEAGRFINLTDGQTRYLHMVAADVTLTASGVSVTITPAIRSSISLGSTVEVNNPTIEGYLTNTDQFEWNVQDRPKITQFSFEIEEAK